VGTFLILGSMHDPLVKVLPALGMNTAGFKRGFKTMCA